MPYGGDPSASFADAVRYTIGDTDPLNELVSDSEITYLITIVGSDVMAVAAQAALNLSHTYAGRVDQTVGKVSVKYSQLAAQWLAVYESLRRRMSLDAPPYAGGISINDKAIDEADTDAPTPAFSVGMMDNS
jgi:hypothetical protein